MTGALSPEQKLVLVSVVRRTNSPSTMFKEFQGICAQGQCRRPRGRRGDRRRVRRHRHLVVGDVIMPPVGLLIGGVDFSNPVWSC